MRDLGKKRAENIASAPLRDATVVADLGRSQSKTHTRKHILYTHDFLSARKCTGLHCR